MITNVSHVMTLANGIIGVSVLAMPFCFKQCGIILSILMLFLSNILSRFACHFLVKSAVMSRRRNFEFLAFHAFGQMGKFLAELFIIGFLMGTCIAFFVVVGDLGPQIVGKMLDKNPEDIRTGLLVMIGLVVILPLGLLRNVDSLSSVCTATIGFYLCLVLKVVAESTTHVFAGDWQDRVFYWRPSGILQCLPIFSMALFCQTQLFEIYQTLPNVCLDKMNQVVRSALNICTVVYVCVGFFGYVAFCTQPFTGNILMSFEPGITSEAIKMGFVLSVAFSFPLVIFPCRASLNSLLYRGGHSHESSGNYIPEARFRCLTFLIVAVSLVTGILIPNIEFVLGLVGSTIGVMICLMFPAAFFISISSKNTNERLVAQVILFVGAWIMILGTYANLYAMEESANTWLFTTTDAAADTLNQPNNAPIILINDNAPIHPELSKRDKIIRSNEEKRKASDPEAILGALEIKDDARKEPPIPVERVLVTEKSILQTEKSGDIVAPTLSSAIKEIVEEIKKLDPKNLGNEVQDRNAYRVGANEIGREEPVILKAEEKIKEIEMKETKEESRNNENLIHSDAIKKEESELAENGELAKVEAEDKREELRKTLEKHKLEQQEMLQEQKKVLKDLREQKEEFEKERKEKLASKKLKRLEADNELRKEEAKENEKIVPKANLDIKNTKADKIGDGRKDPKFPKDPAVLKSSVEINANRLKMENKIGQIKTDTQIFEKKLMNENKANKAIEEEKIKNPKAVVTEQKIVENSRGPILNALARRKKKNVILPNVTTDEKNNGADKTRKDQKEKSNLNVADEGVENPNAANLKNDQQLPIALIMNNKTKNGNNEERTTVNKSEEGIKAIRRDILESHAREKRDAGKIGSEKIQSFVEEIANEDDEEKCTKTKKFAEDLEEEKIPRIQVKILDDEKSKEEATAELLLIKTNAYLSEQAFADGISREFAKSKQRDLQSLDSNTNEIS